MSEGKKNNHSLLTFYKFAIVTITSSPHDRHQEKWQREAKRNLWGDYKNNLLLNLQDVGGRRGHGKQCGPGMGCGALRTKKVMQDWGGRGGRMGQHRTGLQDLGWGKKRHRPMCQKTVMPTRSSCIPF